MTTSVSFSFTKQSISTAFARFSGQKTYSWGLKGTGGIEGGADLSIGFEVGHERKWSDSKTEGTTINTSKKTAVSQHYNIYAPPRTIIGIKLYVTRLENAITDFEAILTTTAHCPVFYNEGKCDEKILRVIFQKETKNYTMIADESTPSTISYKIAGSIKAKLTIGAELRLKDETFY